MCDRCLDQATVMFYEQGGVSYREILRRVCGWWERVPLEDDP